MITNIKLTKRWVLWVGLFVITALVPTVIWWLRSPLLAKADSFLKFDEGYGATTGDQGGNISGTITGAVWKSDDLCRNGKCLYFDGDGDYISFGDDADLDFAATDNFTITGWFRHAPITSGTQVIVAKYNAATGTDGGYKIYMESDGDITFGIDDDESSFPEDSVTSTAATYDDNRWHHFAAVKTGTTSISLYIDAVLISTNSSTTADNTLANTDAFYVGIDGDGASNDFNGFIDEIKIYTSAKTADQIKTEYINNSPLSGAALSFGSDQSYLSNGLVGYWKMNDAGIDAEGEVSLDSSGNSNGATLYGDNGVGDNGTGMDCTAASKFGTGCSFDGTDDYLSVAASASTNNLKSGNISVSAWIKTDAAATNQGIYAKRNDNFQIYNYSGNRLRLAILNGGDSGGSTTLSTGVWYFVTATYSDTGDRKARLYINGVEDGYLWQDAGTGTVQDDSAYATILGKTSTTGNFDGFIDELRFYNRILSPAEIQQMYYLGPTPVGYWKMDENTGTTAYDTSGNGNDLTLTNTPTFAPGKFGSAITTAGSDAHLTRADDADFDFAAGASFTISGWIKHGTASAAEIIMSKYNEAGYKILMESDGDLTCGLDYDSTWTPTDSVTSSAATYDDGSWHHITCVKNEDTSLTLYIDGLSVGTPDTSLTASTLENSDPLYLGIDADGTSNDWLGSLDDFKIYNYARTSAQIIQDMNAGHPAPGSPIGSAAAYWKFDDGYSTTAQDSGPNNLDLTLSAASWTKSGKIGNAWDGADNKRVSITDAASGGYLDPLASEDFTISAWFKSDGATTAATEYLISKTDSSAGYQISFDTSGYVICGIDDDATSFPEDSATTSVDYYDQTWHQVVCVRDIADDKLYLYIDGRLAGQDTDLSATGSLDNSAVFYVGDQNATDGTDEFLGNVDEVKFYRLALNAEQVKVEYNLGKAQVLGSMSTDSSGNPTWAALAEYCAPSDTSTCRAPVLESTFSNNTGTSADDISGNSNTGTLTSGAAWVAGKFGAGVKLDYVNDFISFADSATLDLTSGFTIDFWFQPTATFNNLTERYQGLMDKGAYKVYLDKTDGKLKVYFDSTTTDALAALGSGVAATFIQATLPVGDNLIVGGNFTSAGGVTANYVAKWDGSSWSAMGGTDPDGIVSTITTYKGDIIIGGAFGAAGGDAGADRVARWTGSNWAKMGATSGANGTVRTMIEYKGYLYIGGDFTSVDGVACDNICRWNGSSWTDVANPTFAGNIYEMLVYDDKLYVVGTFTTVNTDATMQRIAVWDGVAWDDVGGGIASGTTTESLGVYRGKLYVSGNNIANRVQIWDGSSWTNTCSSNPVGMAFATYNGLLYMVGNAVNMCGVAECDYWCKFDGSTWSDPVAGDFLLGATALSIGEYKGKLVVGGDWVDADSNTSADSIFTYSGGDEVVLSSTTTSWTANQWYYAVISYDGSTVKMYVNGVLENSVAASITLPTNTQTFLLGKTNGTSQNPNGGGGSGELFNGSLDNFAIYDYTRTPEQVIWSYNRGAPVAWYRMDECTGATIYNGASTGNGTSPGMNGTIYPVSSGNTAVGTCNSGTSTEMWNDGTMGKYSGSVGFDGTDDYGAISDTAALRFDTASSDFSIFAWVKRGAVDAEHYVLSKEDADNDGWRMVINSSNTVTCSQDSTDVTSATTIDTNWHHLGCTFDRDGNGQVYIDGRVDGAAGALGTDAMATTANLTIAARSYSATSFLNGQVDEVKIYNYSLKPVQVREVFNGASVKLGQ